MVSLERASIKDADLFARLEQAPDTKQYILPFTKAEHERRIREPAFVYLRILDGGRVMGFFILVLDADQSSVEFRRIVVSDKGRGIGQSAIHAMEQFCRTDLRRTRIWLDVFEHNSRGQHVYNKLGYEGYGESNHESGKLLLYQKWL
jgi:diamine N-acetyltransferase